MTTESINQMEAGQVETGDIQMEAGQGEDGGIQTEAVQVENGVLQTEAGQVETGGIQTEAGLVEIVSIQTEAGQDEAGGIQTKAGQVEIGGIQTEAGQIENGGIHTEDGPVENGGIQTEAGKVGISGIQTEAGQVEIGDIHMEVGEVEIGVIDDKTIGTSNALANPPAQAEHFDSPKFEPTVASSSKKRKFRASNQDSQVKDTRPSVSNCYPFKSRLQEYCNKAGLTSPVYEIIKEGSSQEHSYRSTVIVNNVKYDSPPGFFNRKAAQLSAAEVALKELANSVDKDFGISQPVHEIGLCKSLLQEYAQKMNYAIPSYDCREDEEQGRTPMFSCVVEVGGIKYVGASATTKKEAKIKAARTAMLAIQAATSLSENQTDNSVYTVIPPPKKMVSDLGISTEGPTAAAEPSKSRLRKLKKKKKQAVKTSTLVEGTTCLEVPDLGISAVGPKAVPKLSRSQRLKLKREKMMQSLRIGTSGEGTPCPEVNTDSQVKSCTSGDGTTCSEVNTDCQVKIGTSGEGPILSEVNTDSQDTLAIQSAAPFFENQTPSTVNPVISQNEKVPEPVIRNMASTTEARTRRNRLKAEKRKNKKQALKGLTSSEGTTSVVVKTEGPTSAMKLKKRDFKNQDWKNKRQLSKNYTSRGGPNSRNRAGSRVVGPAMPPHHYMDERPDFIPIKIQHHERETPPTRMSYHMDDRATGGVSYHMDDRVTDGGGVSYHMDDRVTDGGSYLTDDRETGGMNYHMDDRVTGGMSYHMDDRETGYVTYPWVPPPMNTIYQKYY